MITIEETRDAALLATLNESVQRLHHEMHPEIFKAFDKAAITAALTEHINRPSWRAYIAFDGGAPVAYILFFAKGQPENAFKYATRSLYIDQIGVQREYKGKGIGKMLLSHVELWARENSITVIELDHWATNHVAAAFFEK